jgi:hypothetical protein
VKELCTTRPAKPTHNNKSVPKTKRHGQRQEPHAVQKRKKNVLGPTIYPSSSLEVQVFNNGNTAIHSIYQAPEEPRVEFKCKHQAQATRREPTRR